MIIAASDGNNDEVIASHGSDAGEDHRAMKLMDEADG